MVVKKETNQREKVKGHQTGSKKTRILKNYVTLAKAL